jgi:alpha-glucoside transport system permease protein
MAKVVTDRAVVTELPGRRKPRRFSLWAWLWIAPAVILLLLFFIYPLITTIIYSLEDASSTSFVGVKNYVTIFTDSAMLNVLKNNLIWLVLGTFLTVGLGLLVAVLVDRVKIESVIKSALFIPMAISFVGAGIIWRFVYIYEPSNQTQIGLLNAILSIFHIPPQAWLINYPGNNIALIVVYTWMWTGFCMVILSAALKGIPEDVIEAAKIDGVNRWTMFWRITIPLISPTLTVVATTMIINILKIFDVIYVMTGGNYNTDVIAMEFYNQLFEYNNYGLASALAIILTITIIPIMIYNVRKIRREEAGR